VAAWHNDVFSLDKELAYGDVHNLVLVIAREPAVSLPEARALAVARCNAEVDALQVTARRLPSFGEAADPIVADFVMGMGALMRGNLDWSLETLRYRGEAAALAKRAAK
jgi:hypothetical protein